VGRCPLSISYIDGRRFAKAFVAGAQWVASKRLHLNEINVFPVPDGDTGTNLTLTLKSASDAVRRAEDRPLGEVASALSRAVLLGARGNAGIILAQFLRGFAREIQSVDRLYPRGFAKALEISVRGAYDAMAEPTEGTILTVIRESVGEVRRLVDSGESDFAHILEAMKAKAESALANTPELLPVLKEAGVVDAGGEGFVDLLDGMLRLLRGHETGDALDSVPTAAADVLPSMTERDLKYRYCTEFMVEGPDVDADDLRVRLVGMGGSLIVVGGPGLARVHVHTNQPDAVMRAARALGDVGSKKIDDMREQHREFIRRHADMRTRAHEPSQETESVAGNYDSSGEGRAGAEDGVRLRHEVRVVTDSTADLPSGIAKDLGVLVAPLTVNFEDGSYLDGVDLSRDAFYAKLAACRVPPSTSQPSPESFLELYEELSWETKAALSVHISSAMSGTVQSARAAAEMINGLDVRVVDSGLASLALGMVVIEAARAARSGASLPELEALASDLCSRARIYFTVGTLDYLVKGGRIGRAKAMVGKLARLRPILTIEDGHVTPGAKAVGDDGVLDRLVELAESDLKGSPGGMLGVVHAGRPDMAERVCDTFRRRFSFDEIIVFELGGIVGTHAGPGTWGIGYFRPQPRRSCSQP
jgi:DegV family protein with EDD domain